MAQLVDFSPIGDLANIYRQAQQQSQTAEWLQSQGLPQNLSLANLALSQQRDQRNFGWQQQEAARAQSNTDRSFQLQKEQADAAARGYEIRERDGPNGKELIRVHKQSGAAAPLVVDGEQTAPQNPFATGKLNETQSKDALFASRMMGAEKILRSIDAGVATDRIQKGLGTISDRIGYDLRSPEFTKFDQAKRDFINAVLRKESGAVISESEFKNAEQQYFPQPGQGAEIIAQKRQARAEAIRGIAAGAGPGYRPSMMFDEKGELIDNPATKQAPKIQAATPNAWRTKEAVTAARANLQAALAEAKDAIAKGASRDAVLQRLRQVGIPVDGL